MRDAKVKAYGLEISPKLAQRCRAKGLDVVQEDWKLHLVGLSDNTLGGIFSAQFVEHLNPNELMEFFQLSFRKLRPGGCLVVETLTPCLNTMLAKFYVDFTHKNPLNPDALMFLASYIGFKNITVDFYNNPPVNVPLQLLPVNGEDDDLTLILNDNLNKLNRLIFLPHYFSVVAVK